MFHQHFLFEDGTDPGHLDDGERVLWRGRCAAAEYAFDEPSSAPRWTLPEATDVEVTDRRVRYAYNDGNTLRSGELFWLWPQHLRVQPSGKDSAITQIQMVCSGPGGAYPALVFAGGAVATIGEADRFANVLRQAIARFRVENAEEIGVPAVHARMLAKLLIGPEFSNYMGGQGQTVSLLGSVPVPGPEPLPEATPVSAAPVSAAPVSATPVSAAPVSAAPVSVAPVSVAPVSAAPVSMAPVSAGPGFFARPGLDADAERAERAQRAEQAARYEDPELASRASSLAARVASLISTGPGDDAPGGLQGQTMNLSAYLMPDGPDPAR